MYEKAQTPREWHVELFDHAMKAGITCFSSAFSIDGVKFLHDLGAPAIKIASPEIADAELIAAAWKTGLPLIVSTGMADGEILYGVPAEAIFLHCIARYPSRIEEANLLAITRLRDSGRLAGLSDHTPGIETAIAATALGAVMIEKHFKIDDNCIDAEWSLNPYQFATMCRTVRAIWRGMGDGKIRPTCKPRRR